MTCLFLTGFMGTGKSSIGTRLAARLAGTFWDLDKMIVSSAGKSINDIFATMGEVSFRRLETDALKALSRESYCIVATGGGAVLAAENRRIMREKGLIINLTAPAEEIQRRLQHERERPLLRDDKSIEKIAEMLSAREEAYADADFRIDTNGKSVAEIVEEIYLIVKERRQ